MPLLASLLGNGFSGLVAFFAAMMTKRLAVAAALGVFLTAGWVALQVSLYALWVSLAFVIPTSLYSSLAVVGYLLPTNTDACFNALVVARVAIWAWREQRDYAKAISFVT